MKLILTLITLLPLFFFGQEKTRRIPILLENGLKAVVEVDNTNKKIKPKAEYTYFWFKSKSILSTEGAYQGDLLHGVYQENYLSKQLKTKGSFKYGLKNGIWRYWNEKGELLKQEKWKKGTEKIEKVKPIKEKKKKDKEKTKEKVAKVEQEKAPKEKKETKGKEKKEKKQSTN